MRNGYIKNYDRFVILVWILIFGVFWLQYMGAMNMFEAFLLAACIILSAYPFTTYLSKRLLARAMEKKNMFRFVIQFFSITIIYSLLVPFILILFDYLENINIFPDSELLSTWNGLSYEFLNAFLVSLTINLSFCGLRFFEQNIRLQKELADSHFQILQAQINPHFMFNVLNHVNILIRKEPDLASSVLVQYTNILRYQLYSGKKDFVSIRQEVEFLKDFIEIENIRCTNSQDGKYFCDIEDENVSISPLMLITFVENAFKHVSRSKVEKGYVYIDLKQKNGELVLNVENSKYKDNLIKEKKEESGIGLDIIKKRLDILYHNRYSLIINDSEASYSTTLLIKL